MGINGVVGKKKSISHFGEVCAKFLQGGENKHY